MSHLAIARKWRPQRFEEIVGQTHVTQTLQNAIRQQRVHHAYLFTGARGVGKTSAARILAKALDCANGPADNPCNECENCREITAGTHPDVMEIDGASHNRVDDIRDLIETVRYMPSKGKYRIYVIDEVHMVTTQAFNALLKTLEEPPAHVLFIFATTDPQKIPDTVLSRCQRYDFKMMPARTILGRLREICEGEGTQVPDGVLGQIAREAAGSMRDGQSLLDQVLSFADGAITEAQAAEILGLVDRSLLHELMHAVARGEADQTIEVYGRIIEFGVDIRSLAADILTLLRHATVIAAVRDPDRLVDLPTEEIGSLREMGREAGVEGLGRRFDLLSGAMDEIARSDAPDMVLEMTLVRMARVRPFVPVDELVERLLALERRIAGGGISEAPPGRGGGPGRDPRTERPRPPRRPEPPPMARASEPAPQAAPEPAPKPEPEPVAEPETGTGRSGDPAETGRSGDPAEAERSGDPAEAERSGDPAEYQVQPSPDSWARFLDQLPAGPLSGIRALLAEGRLLGRDGRELRIGFPRPATLTLVQERVDDPALHEALAVFFGARVTLRPEPAEGEGPPSPAEQDRADAEQRRQQREQTARDHPAIDVVRAVFPGTEVQSVKHLTER